MTERFPEAFVSRMRVQLGDELTAFLDALESPPVRGIRINRLKPSEAAGRYQLAERIPWAENGFYLEEESDAGSGILHAAGAFYIQEPSAMLPAAVLNAQPGEKILDLCAAPGGKSTQMGCAMKGEGLLICNEPITKRAQILSGNIERIGLPNTIVTNAWPDRLADQWPEAFDAVLADVPCSGEGMFRRDPETRGEWTAEKAEGCAERQREIMKEAARLVRPGGRLVYSTCTYNPAENEENVNWFIQHFPDFHTEAFSLPDIEAPGGMYTCYPHRVKGEGQFVALFRRAGEGEAYLPCRPYIFRPTEAERAVFEDAFPAFPKPTHRFGKTLVFIPEMPDLNRIRVLRIGLHLGEVRGRIAIPDHAAAHCFQPPGVQTEDLSPEQAAKYMAGETLSTDHEGWTLLRYQGLVLGWGKGSGGVMKNHYPKGLRSIRYTL